MTFKKEKIIEISSWIIMFMLLIKFVPKKKIREAHVVFLFTQVVTWLMGALVVEKGNIKYLIRTFFKKTIKSNFTFEYFIFPAWCVC